MRMMLAVAVAGLGLAGCAGGPAVEADAACAAQGFAPGSDEYRACMDAGGAAIATGPGSPYWNADAEEDNGT